MNLSRDSIKLTQVTLTFSMCYPLHLLDLSAMVRGAIGENLKVEDYKEEDVPKILKEFFDSLW